MKKKIIKLLTIFIILYSITFNNFVCSKAMDKLGIRACWISYLDFQLYLLDLNENEFTQKVNSMYDNIINNKLNTVIVHCRAMGDSFYPSDLFPWSEYVSSTRSNPGYDPIKIMVTLAHEKGLRFEAWVNPYRISRNNETTESFEKTPYYEKYKDIIISYKDPSDEECLSLDPSREEAINLVKDGVLEIVNNYDIDGIHFDDYFYVDGMFESLDSATKQANVNKLITLVYSEIKNAKPECTFGVSPAGNIENAKKQGVDINEWLSNDNYVDYIMPQIYWSDTYTSNDETKNMFLERCNDWTLINKNNIPLYVGLALYKVDEPSSYDIGWNNKDNNLALQYETALNIGYSGYSIFRYEWLEADSAKNELSNLYNYINTLNVEDFIRAPQKDIKVYGVGSAFIGVK